MKNCNSPSLIRQPARITLITSVIVLMSAGCNVQNQAQTAYNKELSVGNKKIFVEVADTPQKKQQGLSGREKLNDDQGMLFDFGTLSSSTSAKATADLQKGEGARPAFWMKEMKFDLDLIWIRNGKIIAITPNVPAPQIKNKGLKTKDNVLPLYYPPDEIDHVLEVNAGWSRENEVGVGDEIKLIDKN